MESSEKFFPEQQSITLANESYSCQRLQSKKKLLDYAQQDMGNGWKHLQLGRLIEPSAIHAPRKGSNILK